MTGPVGEPTPLLRVVRGRPDAEELAALTAVLLSAAAPGAEPDDISRRERAVARWSRLERAPGFSGARSWQDEPG
ncbi:MULTISPECIES: acyl-CoA carboxylase subunit epsilon [unclassified Streptomyces]|uniref:acyl-CoA carboxylase subunit epsilon n=1 Tax=unclassified Streptomyces TaxID=2593676 RepID=UPI00278C6BA7|nr:MULTISPECIES: acyl-CoA carboxylase subunit epsilon [unclassified Streptomyces]